MFIVILCHAAPVPIIVTVILNQTVTVFLGSGSFQGRLMLQRNALGKESAKANSYPLHLKLNF